MLRNETNEKEYIWNRLQEPARPAKAPAIYLLLLAALDTGWSVLEPVRFGTGWENDPQPVYQFLLHRSPSPDVRLLTIPATDQIDQFLRKEGWQVTRSSLNMCASMPLYLS